jgi:predicted metal-dependent HD superfamily phosphohydrolase
MAIDPQLLASAEEHARFILANKLPEGCSYHTIEHTLEVVRAIETIGKYIQLEQDQIDLVQLAAWLHDLGYIHAYIGHEEEGMRMAREYLSSQGAEEEVIRPVEQLIEATKLDQPPRNLLEEVIKDADLCNLATPDALENSEKIRAEWKHFLSRDFSDEGWDQFNYRFFKEYIYYTKYGKEILGPARDQNLRKLKKRIKKRTKSQKVSQQARMEVQLATQEQQIKKLERRLKKFKKQQPDRGIETMFRTTYRTHISLSSIADNKANILLSVNAIIISVIFSSVLGESGTPSYVLWPSILMLVVSLATMIYAILSTRPKVNSLTFTREDIVKKKTNLLFFGNFHNMGLDDYLWGIKEMMNDGEYLYGSMTKDIYFLGVVLAKKFRLLRGAYNTFMYGMIGVMIFALVLWIISDFGA